MIKPKFGDKIGSYFIFSKNLHIVRIIDSPLKTFTIMVDMSEAKYLGRHRKTQVIPLSLFTEINVKVEQCG